MCDLLAAESRSIVLAAGQVLFRRGTPSTGFYLVREGRMQLSVSNSEGLVKVIEILSPGSAFGHAVMFLREPYPVDATALADTGLVFVPVGAVDRVLDEDPSMARIMLASMAKRLQSKIQDITMLSLQSATQRIVALRARRRRTPATDRNARRRVSSCRRSSRSWPPGSA